MRVALTLSKQGLSGERGDSFIYLALTERLLYAPRGTRRPAENEAHMAPPRRGTTHALQVGPSANHADLADKGEARPRPRPRTAPGPCLGPGTDPHLPPRGPPASASRQRLPPLKRSEVSRPYSGTPGEAQVGEAQSPPRLRPCLLASPSTAGLVIPFIGSYVCHSS